MNAGVVEGEARATDGSEAAAGHACQSWDPDCERCQTKQVLAAELYDIIEAICTGELDEHLRYDPSRDPDLFTAHLVRWYAEQSGMDDLLDEFPQTVGQPFRKASKDGLIVDTGMSVKSPRPVQHATLSRVWRINREEVVKQQAG
jgi:hypothetical protein